ncbi:MAG: RNA-binding protein [Chitinophagaceae bacterium]|nr:MAG: RNA-binding protein [Chitinophagaceae bacterium]
MKGKLIYIFATLALVSCRDDESRMFTSLDDDRTGIDFKNTLREDDAANVMNYLYFYNGGGVAAGDINNDGLPDLFFTGNMVPNRLYLNKGDFEFEDITEKSGVASQQGWCTGAAMADVNGDGLLDIYICRSADVLPQRRQNLLYINQGNGTFTEQAKAYGLADQGYSTQAAFLDYDRDGDLDLFLINHSQQQYAYGAYENTALRKQQNDNFSSKLFRNDNGHFSDVSKQAGIISNVLSFGLGVAVSDLNKDGWSDVYVSNDFNEPDYFYLNNHDGTFTERLGSSMDQVSLFSMGSDAADINNDGLPDLVTMDMLPEDNYMQKMHSGAENFNKFQQLFTAGFYYQYSRNMMHLNNGDGTFSEVAQFAGVSSTDWSWAPLLADLDNDGHRDLFVTNGYARDYTNMDFMKYRVEQMGRERSGAPIQNAKTLLAQMPEVKIPNYAYHQDSGGVFRNQAKEWGLGKPGVSSGAVYADLDNDGDLDLVVNNINELASVYKNNVRTLQPQSHYLRVKFEGSIMNRLGVGASVTAYAGGGILYAEQQPVRGFQSAVEPVVHFGLGKIALIDSLNIRWPDGRLQHLDQQPVDQTITVTWNETLELDTGDVDWDQHSIGNTFHHASYHPTVTNGRGQTDSTTSVTYNLSQDPIHPESPNNQPSLDVPGSRATSRSIFVPVPAITFVHHENAFNDFTVQGLLPSYLSRTGPCMAGGDVNGDGLEDMFVGGAAGQPGQVFIQSADGSFRPMNCPALDADKAAENTRSVLFDADGDGDKDLYVASGGYEFPAGDPLYQDRLYLNNGAGQFTRTIDALPKMLVPTGAVAAGDVDGDGDLDLFVGGRVIPGRYPEAPPSYILLNDGKGNFKDATIATCPSLTRVGMVTDAVWTDVNMDKKPDLVIVGDFMAVQVLVNRSVFTPAPNPEQKRGLTTRTLAAPVSSPTLVNETKGFLPFASSGCWNRIIAADLDGDGDEELVLGNMGLNGQLRASEKQPVTIDYKDFDSNGSVDPILNYYIQGVSYPAASRDDLAEQIPMLNKKYLQYETYARATSANLLTAEQSKAVKQV